MLKTFIHTFYFDTRVPAEKKAWLDLQVQLKDGPREMESHGGGSHWTNDIGAERAEIWLETSHLFDNQWDVTVDSPSVPNRRVFDFAFDYLPNNRYIKRGHWLEQTAAMRAIRSNTMACGYCGKQEPAQKAYAFCPHCIGSEYTTEKDLHRTRMLQVGQSFGAQRAELSEAEKAHLLPLWKDAQINGNTERDKKRIAAKRESVARDYKNAIAKATIERDGLTWLMDRGANTENIIFYSPTGRWSWGWRTKVSASLLADVQKTLDGFPFPVDIITA